MRKAFYSYLTSIYEVIKFSNNFFCWLDNITHSKWYCEILLVVLTFINQILSLNVALFTCFQRRHFQKRLEIFWGNLVELAWWHDSRIKRVKNRNQWWFSLSYFYVRILIISISQINCGQGQNQYRTRSSSSRKYWLFSDSVQKSKEIFKLLVNFAPKIILLLLLLPPRGGRVVFNFRLAKGDTTAKLSQNFRPRFSRVVKKFL